MGNSLGRLFSCTQFRGKRDKRKGVSLRRKCRLKKKRKEVIFEGSNNEIATSVKHTDEISDGKRDSVEEKKENTEKFKEESIIEVPQLHDGYMKVSDFKRCEVFLNQPHAVIPDSGRTIKKPDAVYGYITEDENYDNTARKETKKSTDEMNGARFEAKRENMLHEDTGTIKSNNSDYQQRLDIEEKCLFIQAYANDAKRFTMSRLETRKKRATFMSLPNLSDIKQNPEYQSQKMCSTKSSKYHRLSALEVSFTEMDEINELEVIDVQGQKEEHQMKELKLIIGRRNSGLTETSTDSGQASSATSFSETRLKQTQNDRYFCSKDCSKCRAVNMAYMVEVYEPLIVRQIRVTDILALLPFLDDRNKEILRNKHMQSPHGAMELLIKMVKRSEVPGKWQCFYDAVAETEFTYISMLLKEETETQYDYSSTVLTLIKPEIMSRIYLPDFLDKIFERELVTEAEKDEAESLNEIGAKTYILDRVDKHLPNWDHVFIEVLNESCMGDLAELFKLVSQKAGDHDPNQKMEETRHHRRTIKRRRQHITKIAHGNAEHETEPNQTQMIPSFTNDFSNNTENFSDVRMVMEKSVTDLATAVDELKARLGNSDSELCTTLLQKVVLEQMRLSNQQKSICNDIESMRNEMIEMKTCINKIFLSVVR